MPSFGGEVKPSVPRRRFAACKRSLNLCGSQNLGKITGQISRPQFHLSLLGSLVSLRTYRHLAAKVGMSEGGGKQWQTTPKNLPKDAVCQSHTIHMTGLWFLPTRPLRLNTNERIYIYIYIYIYTHTHTHTHTHTNCCIYRVVPPDDEQ